MASPQLENGYTSISNEIMDALCKTRIPGEARQILDIILRKTYGWKRCVDSISLSQFVDLSGINKQCVIRAINKLVEMNMIVIEKDTPPVAKKITHVTRYRFNKDYETWKPLSKKITLSKKIINVIEKDNNPVSKKIHTKESLKQKEILLSFGKPNNDIFLKNENDKTPYKEIVSIFHEVLPEFPPIIKLTDARKTALRGRWNTEEKTRSLEWWREYFEWIRESDFLMGRTKNSFACGFDWIIKAANFIKIREGNYHK